MIDKYAYTHNRIRKLARQMRKRADLFNDAYGSGVSGVLTGAIPTVTGHLIGLAGETPTVAQLKKIDNQPGLSYIPGVGQNRITRRQKTLRSLLKDDPDSYDAPVTDIVGTWTNPLAYTLGGGLAGLGLGGMIGGGEGAATGAALGAGAGALTSVLGGGLGTLIGFGSRKRTLEQQAEAENRKHNLLLNTLIPGRATYNRAMRMNTSQLLSGMSEDDINKEVARIKKQRGVK